MNKQDLEYIKANTTDRNGELINASITRVSCADVAELIKERQEWQDAALYMAKQLEAILHTAERMDGNQAKDIRKRAEAFNVIEALNIIK